MGAPGECRCSGRRDPAAASWRQPLTLGPGAVETAWLLATPLIALAALLPGGGWVLALAAPLFVYRGFIRRIEAGDLASAMTRGVAWAVLLSAGVVVVSRAAPEAAGAHIVHAAAYRDEMFSWIETGIGREGEWRSFVPQHALHLGAFVALVLVSRGYLGLVLGALLLAYMNFFVASFAAASGHPWLGVVQAWFPWSVARVLAFIALGVVLSVRPWATAATPAGRRLLALAALGLLIDLLLKAWLAPQWGLELRSLAAAGGAR